MSTNNTRFDRKAMRLKDYDYSQSGFYLVTICVENRQCIFGEIGDGTMHLNDAGLVAQSMWESLPRRFSTVQLDNFVVMPNHVHGIIEIIATQSIPEGIDNNPRIAARFQAHMRQEAIQKANPTLGQIVRTFKGATTHDIRKFGGRPDFAWQGRYYDSVLRNDKALDHTRDYIINNPLTWQEDSLRV